MKISRGKKLQKTINFYVNNFGFREPFQVLVDATFCQIALKNQVKIREQLTKYFQSELKLLTTPCIIIEAEKLGPKVSKAAYIVKQFAVHKCGHEGNPIPGSACFRKMAALTRYVIATQDRELQAWIRKRAGQPLIYLHKMTPVLETPSEASMRFAEAKCEEKVCVNMVDVKRLEHLKEAEGITPDTNDKKPKKKKKKNPNPLSCKKKKKKPGQVQQVNSIDDGVKDGGVQKQKRKKIKLPKHAREHILNVKKQLVRS